MSQEKRIQINFVYIKSKLKEIIYFKYLRCDGDVISFAQSLFHFDVDLWMWRQRDSIPIGIYTITSTRRHRIHICIDTCMVCVYAVCACVCVCVYVCDVFFSSSSTVDIIFC